MRCNSDIIKKIHDDKSDNLIDNFKHTKPYQPQFVYSPEQLSFHNDIPPSGRLINFVLQEAPGLSIQALKHHQMSDPYLGPKIAEMLQKNAPLDGFQTKYTT